MSDDTMTPLIEQRIRASRGSGARKPQPGEDVAEVVSDRGVAARANQCRCRLFFISALISPDTVEASTAPVIRIRAQWSACDRAKAAGKVLGPSGGSEHGRAVASSGQTSAGSRSAQCGLRMVH